MTVYYLANVGTRDVAYAGGSTTVPAQDGNDHRIRPRLDGERWLREFESRSRDLSAPILHPGLSHVLSKIKSEDIPIRVVLFYSDQDLARVREFYWQNDTVYFAQLLEKLLPAELGSRVTVQSVRIDGNPADYNNTLAFFRSALPDTVQPDASDPVYVAPVGGADASNVGLAINAVRRYRSQCQFIYVLEKVGVQVLNLHHELLDDYAKREAEAHLRRRDYAALEQALRQSGLGPVWLQHLCSSADHRTRFDFQGASDALEQAKAALASGQHFAELGQIAMTLAPFLENLAPPSSGCPEPEWSRWFDRQRDLLRELYFNLQRKARQGEWVDFLSRLFRLQEAVLRLVFEQETRHSTHRLKGSRFEDFRKALDANPGLSQSLRENDTDVKGPNSRNLLEALSYWVKEPSRGSEIGPIYNAVKAINLLNDLRNQSIAAHGFRGCSRADIESYAGVSVDDLLGNVKRLLDLLKTKVEVDPFDMIDSLLKESVLDGN